MLIKGAIVCDFEREQKDDVRIQGGRVVEIAKSLLPLEGEEVIRAEGLTLLPAMIDTNARVANGSLTGKNLAKLAQKAIQGGVGSVALMPDCTPALDNEAAIELLRSCQSQLDFTLFPLAAAHKSGDAKLSDLSILHQMGCVGIALDSSLDGNLARRACEYALMLRRPLFCRCEDASLRGNGVMNDGRLSSKLGLPGIPSLSESKEVAKMAEMAIFMGVSMVFQALSSERSLRLVERAKEENPALFSEVSIHHLARTEDLCTGFNTGAKLLPPLKSESTRRKLLNLLKEGKIDLVSSLQSEHSISKKDVAFEEAAFGIDAIEDHFALCYTYLIKQGRLTLSEMSRVTSKRAAEVLGLERKGYIGVGAEADLILVDLKSSRVVEDSFSPYYNTILYGEVEKTILAGNIVYQRNKG